MKKRTYLFSCFLTLAVLHAQAQKQDTSCKGRLEIGVGVLPVYDIINLFPDNKIEGFAVLGNFGFFLSPKLSFGILPFFGRVSNTFTGPTPTLPHDHEALTAFGLNTYLRLYVHESNRTLFYMSASGGFGTTRIVRTGPLIRTPLPQHYPMASLLYGIGFNYRLKDNLYFEANIPVAVIYDFSNPANNEPYFLTVVPTVGLQYRLSRF